MNTANTTTHAEVIPDGPPMMRRRELLKTGISETTIRKLEATGAIRRIFPVRGYGYYLREEVRTAINGVIR